MATKKMNVLVYSGNGSTINTVRHCLYTLRRLLAPAYAVIPVTSDVLLKEPWMASCALLVFPGGADLGYCRTLNGEGNRRIRSYVNQGGSYMGFCAGGYYGSARCEFEVDDPKMAVVGDRELELFPGICRGLAFAGFVYNSEEGARAADVKINKEAFDGLGGDIEDGFKSYYNGGGVFVDAEKAKERGVQILASYTEDLHVDSGAEKAAIVYRKVGQGHIVLTGPHPEFAPVNLTLVPTLPSYNTIIEAVASTDKTRVAFLRLVLQKLGLNPNEEEESVPSLSRLHLSSHNPSDVADLVASWSEVFTVVEGEEYIKAENDVFHIEKEGAAWGIQGLKKAVEAVESALPTTPIEKEKRTSQQGGEASPAKKDKPPQEEILDRIAYTQNTSPDQILDYDHLIKHIVPHDKALPPHTSTPSFDHASFYANLTHHNSKLHNTTPSFGTPLLYGAVVTSTNTLLDKNPTLLRTLPTGTTLTATHQLSARGRGANVWLAPPGALMFSTILHHPIAIAPTAPIIFIQYLAALATIRGIHAYSPAHASLPIHLKWPNDIYAHHPSSSSSSSSPPLKIGGILVNSSYTPGSYTLVCGIGLNLDNALPTTSLNRLAAAYTPPLPPLRPEKLLASILAHFEALYAAFVRDGWSAEMEAEYYARWLHSGQIVSLETHGGVRARIKGITRDWGLLLAEELGWEDRPTGRMVSLQSDSNSFDFFRGLIKRKV